MKDKPKKLTLNQETLRNLTEDEVRSVAGGITAVGGTCRINSCGCTGTCHIVSICEICP